MLGQEDQLATLKLIDQRQDQLLEDLERLNKQILDIIDVYTTNRPDTAPSQADLAA